MSELPAVVRQTKPFNTAVLFSGGGLRFGYYLGMYQALYEQAKTPDIILASCGGALVAGLLEVTGGDSEQAFERLQSRECYDMLCRITNLTRFIPLTGLAQICPWQLPCVRPFQICITYHPLHGKVTY
ncbi:patatin-like phospholipase family protein [Psychrobacter sp.]|uniref:patatin-like phospholipase family protein n=1 Tax=Psychrobacter sp. TaxID=56811 RepID=UPI003F976FC4